MYDVIIIGGGAAGLYCALHLSKKHNILLLDERNYLGGRIHSHRKPQYEIGAARFHKKQKHLCNLIKKYKLTPYKLPDNSDYLDKIHGYIPVGKDFFHTVIKDVLNKSKSLSKSYLQNITFKQLCEKYYNHQDISFIINVFGYRCEFMQLSAYEGCNTFSRDFIGNKYYILAEGLSTLCNKMEENIIKNKGSLLCNKCVTNVTRNHEIFCVEVNNKQIYKSNKVIFAIKPHQMKEFSLLQPIHHHLKSVFPGKLLRIYAVFPRKDNKVWFNDLNRTTTNSFLRHIIPISKESGLIMISYTDGLDVKPFLKSPYVLKDDNVIEKMVLAEVRALFSEVTIPNPTYFKSHFWSHGAHFWKVGYDSDKIIKEMINPLKNVYTCGEGFSKKQAWIEGALESAQLVINNSEW